MYYFVLCYTYTIIDVYKRDKKRRYNTITHNGAFIIIIIISSMKLLLAV